MSVNPDEQAEYTFENATVTVESFYSENNSLVDVLKQYVLELSG